ncbi:MAG: response regulator [Qingshengfaniella sp.]
MSVLIVEDDPDLGQVWRGHIESLGHRVELACDQSAAIRALQSCDVALILLDMDLRAGSALAIADFAGYRHPDLRVLFLTARPVFTDGSIFRHAPNACGFVPAGIRPEDLALMVDHHAARPRPADTNAPGD